MTSLRGVRVLVVEDEAMLSLALQDMLDELGCQVVGTAARLEPALDLARELAFDVAVLDLNLDGKDIHAVAEAIAERGLPCVFATGYGREGAPRYASGTIVEKPYQAGELQRALMQALSKR